MSPDRQRIEALFEAALERSSGERSAFLAEACGRDPDLYAEVEALLAAHERTGGVLERGPFRAVESPAGTSPPARDAVRWRPGSVLLLSGLGSLGLIAAALLLVWRLGLPFGASVASVLAGLVLPFWILAASRATARGGRRRSRPDVRASATDGIAEGSRVAHYVVLEQLGAGGMGVVHRARDTRLDRYVALKFLPPHLGADPAARERFLVEAQAAATLDHPNICTVYEIGSTADGRLYIAMPYYEGETVREKLARGPLAPAQAIRIAAQVGRGLAKAHAAGVIHRDIKPANLLVTGDGIVKVVDFGVAKLSGTDITRTGAAVGTIAYMSPEQIRGASVTARTDIWSLGVVLYEMLTGRRPFTGEGSVDVMHAILQLDPTPLGELVTPVCDGELQRIIDRCLTKDQRLRIPDMAKLVELLEELEPPAASPPLAPADSARSRPEPAAEGERRPACLLVTVIDRYPELIETLATDELDSLVGRLRTDVERIVEERGGVLNLWSNDRGVALFGLPAAHEDDPVRAVRAALAVHAEVDRLSGAFGLGSPGLRLRMGVTSGTVIARPGQRSSERFQVAGDPVELAERLAGHADAGELLIGEECRARVLPFFETEPVRPLMGRGSDERLTPYRVIRETGLETRLDAAESRGLTSYTGRDRELEVLAVALEKAIQGQGGFVSIVGEAGAGKSRLLLEFRKTIDRREVTVLRGRSQSFGTNVPYLPFVEALKGRLGLHERGAEPGSGSQVAGAIRAISPELESFIPVYLHLLSLEDPEYPLPRELEGQPLRLAILDAMCAIFTNTARTKPTLLLLEDWQWADRASAELLVRLAELAAVHPLLVVATTRPDPDINWGTPARHHPLYLGPLDIEGSSEIIRSVLDAHAIPEELAATLHERTDGNPFFLEEICQALVEARTIRVEGGRASLVEPIEQLELPDTIQGVLRARLDRLDADAREVLRHAAVIGREFPRALLERTLDAAIPLDEALDGLRRLGLIQQIRFSPEPVYRFKHMLTVEAAYESLIRHQLRSLHGAVGEAMEEVYADRLEEVLDRLAHHFSRAELWERAVRYGLRAADKAHALSRFGEALQLLDEVLDWTDRLPSDHERDETRLTILFRQERLCETLGLRARQQRIVDELLARLKPLGESPRLAEAHLRNGDLNTLTREFVVAERELRESLRIARSIKGVTAERNALRSLGLLYWHQGRNTEAIEMAERALALDRERGDLEGVLVGLSNLGNIQKSLGNHHRALDHLFEALELAGRNASNGGPPLSHKLPYILHNIGNIYRALGDNDKAVEYLERAVSYSTGYLIPIQKSFHLTAMAHIRLQQGRLEESLELYRQAVAVSREAHAAEGLSHALRTLGELLLALGRREEAVPHLAEAAEIFADLRDVAAEAATRKAVASAYEAMGRPSEAEAAWKRVRELARSHGAAERELEAIDGLARLSRADDPERARAYYEEALALARALGDVERQAATLNSLGILCWSRAAYDEALECYREALDIYQGREDEVHAGLMLNSIGATLRSMGRRNEAEACLREALELHRRTDERLLEAHALAVLAEIQRDVGDLEGAAIHFDASLELRRRLGDRQGEAWMLVRLARIQNSLGAPEAARASAAEAARIASELGSDQLSRACRELSF